MIYHIPKIGPSPKIPHNQLHINKLQNKDKLFFIPNCRNLEDDIILYKFI